MIAGRKPKPSARRRLEGSRKPYNQREPVLPPTVDLTPPPELVDDAVARAEWTRLLTMLQQARVLTDGDRGALLALCQQWSRYLDASSKVHVSGMVVRSPSGYPMPNPYIGISNKALGNCLKLWAELGLTPTSRTRVAATPVGGTFDDAFAEFDEPFENKSR